MSSVDKECFVVKQKTAYEMRISDWSSDVCSSDLTVNPSVVQLSRATNVAWQINWGFPIDLSIKSMRRNDTEDTYVLQTGWEMQLNDEESGFTMSGRSEEPRVGKECVSTFSSPWSL